MRDRLSKLRLANIMSRQFQVWAGTPNADEIIEDCCHALATELELTPEKRKKFMIECRWSADYKPKDNVSCSTP
jgi:hypothetical protein